jgi:hypothetical protein
MLKAKGFKPKLNIMDNQATKHIQKYLTKNECKLQLVEPHNHRVNAAEPTIQTFKDAFIPELATTDSNFPLQLWDKLTPQVQDTLNLLRTSCIDPPKLAYEILNGRPYDWNRYPLAPLGCKAIVYKDGNKRRLWALRGVDAWYLGPSKDHYRCDLYYIIETRAYPTSGSTELFSQHCQLPDMTPHQHLCALTDKLADKTPQPSTTPKGKGLLCYLAQKIEDLLHPAPPCKEQRVTAEETTAQREAEQRVIDDAPIITIHYITSNWDFKQPHGQTGVAGHETATSTSHQKQHPGHCPTSHAGHTYPASTSETRQKGWPR